MWTREFVFGRKKKGKAKNKNFDRRWFKGSAIEITRGFIRSLSLKSYTQALETLKTIIGAQKQ